MHDVYIAAYALAALISAWIAVSAWRRRPAPGALGLFLLCSGQAWWSLAYALQLLLTGDGPSRFWFVVRMVGLQATPTAILVLALEYSGRSGILTRRNTGLLALEPVLMYVLVLTEPWHNLYLGGHEAAFTQALGGPGWWLNIAYSYTLMLIAAALLAARLVKRRAYRLQTSVLFAAVMLPVMQFLAQIVGIRFLPELNTVPFTYTLTGIVLWYALTRLGLLKVVPIARGQLVEQMSEGIIVFDSNRLIADINPAAMRMTQAAATSIGRTADEAFPGFARAIAELRSGLDHDGRRAVTTTSFPPDGVMEATSTAVHADGDERFATLVMLRDITEQTRAAEELEHKSEQLAAALERASRVLEAMTEGVLLVGPDRAVLAGNPSAGTILGIAPEDLDGLLLDDILPLLPVADLVEHVGNTRDRLATTLTLPDRRSLTVEVIPLLEAESHGARTLFVLRDETERLAAERMQRDFVANAAHELQTPLTGLSLLAETIPRALHDDPERANEFIQRLGIEIQRLVLMTNELMALSRMDGSSDARLPKKVDLALVISCEVKDARHLVEEKRQTLSVDLPRELMIVADEADLAAMVGNLIDNAVRYTPVGGKIAVRLAEETDLEGLVWAVFTVADSGPGISPAHQERVFERFYRVDKSRSARTGGAGLGLSIVRGAVQRAGGTVGIASTPGQGSTFTLRLPIG